MMIAIGDGWALKCASAYSGGIFMFRWLFPIGAFTASVLLTGQAFSHHEVDQYFLQYADEEPTVCDRVASNPSDPLRRDKVGVSFSRIDIAAALEDCGKRAEAVVLKYGEIGPDTPKLTGRKDLQDIRFLYLYARALSAAGDRERSFAFNEMARHLGYPFALYYAYIKHSDGSGTPKDMFKALKFLDEAVEAGVPRAHLQRAKEALEREERDFRYGPDFKAIAQDIYASEKGRVSSILTWAQFYKVQGEWALKGTGKISFSDPQNIDEYSALDLRFKFTHSEVRNYQRNLEASLGYYRDYLKDHPGDTSTYEAADKLEKRIAVVERAADELQRRLYDDL